LEQGKNLQCQAWVLGGVLVLHARQRLAWVERTLQAQSEFQAPSVVLAGMAELY
jgi:hypothetical protein